MRRAHYAGKHVTRKVKEEFWKDDKLSVWASIKVM